MSDDLTDAEFTALMTRMGATTPAPERATFTGYIAKGQAWHLNPRCYGAKTATPYTITGAPGLTLEQAQDSPVTHVRVVNGQDVTVALQPCGQCTARPQCHQCKHHFGQRGEHPSTRPPFCSTACREMYETDQELDRQADEAERMRPYLEAARDGISGYVIAPKGVRYHRAACEALHRHAYSVEPLLSLRVMRWDEAAGKKIPTTLTPCTKCKPEPVEAAR